MANCAISQKGSDEIVYFIRDCIQIGRNFIGSNFKAYGVKEALFDVLWTEDIAAPGDSVKALSDALRYEGRVVSSRSDVDAVTRDMIAAKYSSADEIKAMRLKLSGDESAWADYKTIVDEIVAAGKVFKDNHFPKEVER